MAFLPAEIMLHIVAKLYLLQFFEWTKSLAIFMHIQTMLRGHSQMTSPTYGGGRGLPKVDISP